MTNKGAIEIHMAKIIKNYRDLWIGYNNRLSQVRRILKKLESQRTLSIIEDNLFIRFKSNRDDIGLNSLFFIYEIGRVFLTLTWRHLIGSDQRLNYVLLNKPASYLPAFNFSLDQLTTLLYWGEHVPYLSVTGLSNLKLNNFVLRVNKPSSVEVSVANLVWPKSAYMLKNQQLERLAIYYIYNSLMPPVLDGIDKVWSESPFILIGDRTIRFLTLHKTLCTIDESSAKKLEGRIINVRTKVIDRSFTVRHLSVDVPEEYFNDLVGKAVPHEIIFVKYMKFIDPALTMRPYIRYTIYPFEFVKLFSEESYGWLLSMLSIVLREYYLKSSDPFLFTIKPEEFRNYLVKILSLFSHNYANELGLTLIKNKEWFHNLASMLGVYASNGVSLLYLHPALLSCFPPNLENVFDKDYLMHLQKIAFEYNKVVESHKNTDLILLVQNMFRDEFKYNLNFSEAIQFNMALHNLVKVCIPLSKALCLGGES